MRNVLGSIAIMVLGWAGIACDCIMTPLAEHVNGTRTIASCRVTGLLDTEEQRKRMIAPLPDHGHNVRAVVTTSYKGRLLEGDTIRIASEGSNCDILFQLNGEYVLFFDEAGKVCRVRHCSYSGRTEGSEENIAVIERMLRRGKTD